MLVSTKYFSAMGQRSCNSSREVGRLQCRFIPSRSRATARFRARSYVLRSRTICSRRVVSIALIEVPSWAARIFASRSRDESTLRVIFVFIQQHAFMCSTIIRAKILEVNLGSEVPDQKRTLPIFPKPGKEGCDI